MKHPYDKFWQGLLEIMQTLVDLADLNKYLLANFEMDFIYKNIFNCNFSIAKFSLDDFNVQTQQIFPKCKVSWNTVHVKTDEKLWITLLNHKHILSCAGECIKHAKNYNYQAECFHRSQKSP